jgi:hypothetical protein
MAEEQTPFLDIRFVEGGFSIPRLKWRELLFVGALREDDGDFVRDPTRPLPLFAVPDLFPEGVRFAVEREGDRVVVRRAAPGASRPSPYNR